MVPDLKGSEVGMTKIEGRRWKKEAVKGMERGEMEMEEMELKICTRVVAKRNATNR